MSYNTSIFNLPDLKNDIQNNLPPAFQDKNKCVILGERKLNLNQSRCKFVSIGLAYDFKYEPCVKLSGNKCDAIIFDENEWKCLLNYQGVITNYLYSNDATNPIDAGKFRIEFDKISYVRIVRIFKDNSYICLGYETICKLWECIPLIEYRLDLLRKLKFVNYLNIVQKGLQHQIGNVFDNALQLLSPSENLNSENVSMIMELIYVYPEVFETGIKG